ncbi:MAG TPA: hypothetical protein PK089_05755 [Methanoregulaceae archaeon]|nr:hypothetical protein [Methanoregulaceae archaeon]HOV67056.1 hypothetical protein [Methanoregulaceae archaeon]HQJ86976.1 hypothetical protein [Methanoregulaceae archaeon]
MDWNSTSIGVVLLSGSLVLVGLGIAARLAGFSLPGERLLIMTVLVLVVIGAIVLIAADYLRERGER